MEKRDDLKILEEELYGINNAVNKINERIELITHTESQLNEISELIITAKSSAIEAYDTKYNIITENILTIKKIAENVDYKGLNEIDEDEMIPPGSISYNFNNINYNSLIMSLPKTPPISKEELDTFIKELESKHSNVLLQISQLKSYKKRLDVIINKLSVTALASYLCS